MGRKSDESLHPSPPRARSRPTRSNTPTFPSPSLGTQVLVRVSACAVCRTDLHVIEGELPPRKSPITPAIR